MDLEDRIAQWDAEATTYDEAADHGLADPDVREAWRSLLLAAIPPPPARVAELGCGTGTLALLLAEEGCRVDGLDFAPEMVVRARAKLSGFPGVTVEQGDAFEPPLPTATYDVVLSRHVLWAMPEPAVALQRWIRLLAPGGRLVLIEGSWSTGAGLTAAQTVDLVVGAGLDPELVLLDDPALWGGPTSDERYLVNAKVSRR